MAELNKNYKKIISDIEGKIKNPEELEFVKGKISELTLIFMETIDKLVDANDRQVMIENKLNSLQNTLRKIEEDIYICDEEDDGECGCGFCSDQMHDNDYEFEILCPYCNHEFITGKDTDFKKEIECPNCHNVIELDWEDHCDGECNECQNHCFHEEEIGDELRIREDEQENYKHTNGNLKDKKDENEDDM